MVYYKKFLAWLTNTTTNDILINIFLMQFCKSAKLFKNQINFIVTSFLVYSALALYFNQNQNWLFMLKYMCVHKLFSKKKCASNRSNLPVDMLEMVEWQNDTSLKINHWKEGCSIDLWTKCILIGGNQVKFTVSKLGPDCLCACYGK